MLLEIRNLTKTYRAPDGGDAVDVLRGVDLQMDAGETSPSSAPPARARAPC